MQLSIPRTSFLHETFNTTNVIRLALMSILFTLVDTIQSFYGQKVLNVFTEFNFLPSLFYKQGILGYALYAPVECMAIFATLSVLWFWASYVLWFHHSIISKLRLFNK